MYLRETIPMLWVRDLEETVRFYTEILGFELGGILPGRWATVRCGDASIMFASPNKNMPFEKAQFTGSIYFFPDKVDEVWENLKDKVVIDYPIENFDYGMREFAIRDCNGYLLQFGQDLGEIVEPREEI